MTMVWFSKKPPQPAPEDIILARTIANGVVRYIGGDLFSVNGVPWTIWDHSVTSLVTGISYKISPTGMLFLTAHLMSAPPVTRH